MRACSAGPVPDPITHLSQPFLTCLVLFVVAALGQVSVTRQYTTTTCTGNPYFQAVRRVPVSTPCVASSCAPTAAGSQLYSVTTCGTNFDSPIGRVLRQRWGSFNGSPALTCSSPCATSPTNGGLLLEEDSGGERGMRAPFFCATHIAPSMGGFCWMHRDRRVGLHKRPRLHARHSLGVRCAQDLHHHQLHRPCNGGGAAELDHVRAGGPVFGKRCVHYAGAVRPAVQRPPVDGRAAERCGAPHGAASVSKPFVHPITRVGSLPAGYLESDDCGRLLLAPAHPLR